MANLSHSPPRRTLPGFMPYILHDDVGPYSLPSSFSSPFLPSAESSYLYRHLAQTRSLTVALLVAFISLCILFSSSFVSAIAFLSHTVAALCCSNPQ